MGHGAKTMRDIYEWHDVEGFLAEDGEKFAAYVGPEPDGTLKLVRGAP